MIENSGPVRPVDVVGRFCLCHGCQEWREDARLRRQNTAYVDMASNYACLCDPCQDEADDYWAERWAEYHEGLL